MAWTRSLASLTMILGAAFAATAGCGGSSGDEGIGGSGGTGTGGAGAGGAGTGGAGTGGTGGSGTGGSGGTGAGGTGGDAAAGGEAGAAAAGGAGATGSGGGSGDPSVAGCADGQREGYLDLATHPDIAACAGAFGVPGVKTTASLTPQCNRQAGDDGTNPDGTGCSVADLCATGWHVCESGMEVGQKSDTGCQGADQGFWATRQAMNNGGTACSLDETAVNNVVGCGTTGSQTQGGWFCGPLTRALVTTDCPPGWGCGNSLTEEALQVIKTAVTPGGVLCCRD